MKLKNRLLSIVLALLMICSLLVGGTDRKAYASEVDEDSIVTEELENETMSDDEEEETLQEVTVEEAGDDSQTEEEVVVPADDEKLPEDQSSDESDTMVDTGLAETEEDTYSVEADAIEAAKKAKRTIMLYDVGSNLETEAGLASYNLRQILASRFSSDDDIRFIVMTGGSYRWQLEEKYLAFPEDVNVPEEAGLQRDPYDFEYEEMLPYKSVISGVYNQLWEAKGIDAVDENGDPDPNAGKLVLLDGDGLTGEAVRSEEELMSNPDTLKEFIRISLEKYPAEKYDLILWDHGGGPTGGFGADEHYEYKPGTTELMSFAGLVDAFSDNAVTNNDADGDGENDKFDFINFDACLMNSVELALAMADYTDYYIASAETEPGYGQYYGPEADRDGRHYRGWLDLLGADPEHDTYDLGKVIVDDFYHFYEKEEGDGASQDGTLAVIDTRKMINSPFVNALIELVRVLKNEAANVEEDGLHFYDELKSYYNSIEYSGSELFDLGQVASLLSVVNSEVSEKDLDKEDDYYINCNNYHDISRTIISLMYDDSENAFMYKKGTGGIRSKENYYRTKDDTLGFSSLGTSGMSIYFPGLDYAASFIDYFENIDPVIANMPDGKRKEFLQDYEEALAYYGLILYSGKTIERLINDEEDNLEISDKSEIDYDLFMSQFTEGYFNMWDEIAVPSIDKMRNVSEEDLKEWFRALVPQQVEDAIDRNNVTIEKMDHDEDGACKVIVDHVRKSIINGVDRNIYAELPVLEEYLKTLSPQEQSTAEKWGDFSLGSIEGRLKDLPEGASVADKIKWYNESGGIWDIDAFESKWYAIRDSAEGIHVASLYLADKDGFYIPALIGTKADGPDEDRVIFLEFSNKKNDGDHHVLTSLWFVDMDEGPVKVELKELTGELLITPILWIKPFLGSDIYGPISTPFTLSAANASGISLQYMDVDEIKDIGDVDGDGQVLDSTITIEDLYGYKVKVSDRINIKYARIKPGIYTGEELIPELVYQGEILKEGIDYLLEKDGYYDFDQDKMIYPDFIEPGEYGVYLMGKGRFRANNIQKTFHIILPEDVASQAVEDAREALEEAQSAMQTAIESGQGIQEAYDSLVVAQQALTDAQDALTKTKDVLAEEEQARLQDEIDKLKKDVQDLNEQLAEAKVVDISNYAASLSGETFVYTGKAIKPSVTVPGLSADDYTLVYANNIKIGTARVTITAKGDKYKGTIIKNFVITKKSNTLNVKGKTAKVSYKKLKKKARKLAVSKVLKFSNKGIGKLTYKKTSGSKKITMNKNNGKVTVKKGLKKGTYKIKVTITAAGNSIYRKASRNVTYKIKVK